MRLSGALLLLFLSTSCSKGTKFLVYKDSEYPMTIHYSHKMMRVNSNSFALGSLEPFKPLEGKYPVHFIEVVADLSDEFPDYIDKGFNSTLYQIFIYKTLEGFREYDGGLIKSNAPQWWGEEGVLNNIPTVVFKDERGKPYIYALLIPGTYIEVKLVASISSPSETINKRAWDRVDQLTHDTVKHFQWNQEIDTNSKEFKKWKEHIWGILKSGEKK